MAFNYDVHPSILTDGFLWFKDLSAPDPYGILPILGGLINLMNMLSANTTNMSPSMRRFRRFLFILPLVSIPIWMTFPSVI